MVRKGFLREVNLLAQPLDVCAHDLPDFHIQESAEMCCSGLQPMSLISLDFPSQRSDHVAYDESQSATDTDRAC
jgi:hypothetical protein